MGRGISKIGGGGVGGVGRQGGILWGGPSTFKDTKTGKILHIMKF